jgi:hypothetical protein
VKSVRVWPLLLGQFFSHACDSYGTAFASLTHRGSEIIVLSITEDLVENYRVRCEYVLWRTGLLAAS